MIPRSRYYSSRTLIIFIRVVMLVFCRYNCITNDNVRQLSVKVLRLKHVFVEAILLYFSVK